MGTMENVFFLWKFNFLFDCVVLRRSDADAESEDDFGFGEGYPSLVYAALILFGS